MSNKEKQTNKNIKKQTQIVVPNKKQTKTLVYAIICFLFAFGLYSNTFNHSYVLDDGSIIKDNSDVIKGIKGIPSIIKTSYWHGSGLELNTYRPLTKVMFAIEWQISPNNPHMGHFINVLFYALSCLLLFIVLLKYMNKAHPLIPLVITLLYAAHPIHTEVVANIKSRDEIMSFFFVILVLLFLHKWFTKRNVLSLILSLIMFFLSLLSKEGVITMLFIFPIIAWYFTESKFKTILISSLLLVLPAISYIAIRYIVLSKLNGSYSITILENFLLGATDPFVYFATAVMLLGKYLLLLLIPYQLVCDYSFNQIPLIGLSDPKFIFSFLVYILIGIYSVLFIRKKRLFVFGILFYLITISMYSNIFFKITASFGERLMFLPSLGICIMIVSFFAHLFKFEKKHIMLSEFNVLKKKPLFTLIFIIILISFSTKTVVRAAEWKSPILLFGNDIKRSPNSVQLCMWLGVKLFEDAEKEEDKFNKDAVMLKSKEQYEKGLAIYPAYPECYSQLGLIWQEFGDTNKAFYYSGNALKLDSFEAITWYNTGLLYERYGDFNKAIMHYKRSISMNPNYYNAYLNLGCVLCDVLQKYEESIVEFKKCLQLDPDNINACHNISIAYQNLNQTKEADIWMEKTRKLQLKLKH